MIRPSLGALALALPFALAGCGGSADKQQSADAELSNAADPALTTALQGQIMVDPNLGQQANGDAVRPPAQPYSAPVPADGVATNNGVVPQDHPLLKTPAPGKCDRCAATRDARTLGGLAARQPGPGGKCAGQLKYSAAWANRLPADLPLYPQARVSEAAGADGQCTMRVVSFSVAQPMPAMLDWYYTRAIRAGYSSEHQAEGDEHVLGGTRRKDGAAYVIYMSPRGDGGTDIDLIANKGV